MNWVGVLLLIIHIIACAGLILIVLLQAGKGASLGAAFGGGASQTVFGAQSATFIGRGTWVLAGVFMLTSLLLTLISPWGEMGRPPEATAPYEEPIASPPLGEATQEVPSDTNLLPEDVSGAGGQTQQEATQPVLPDENPMQPVSQQQAATPDVPEQP